MLILIAFTTGLVIGLGVTARRQYGKQDAWRAELLRQRATALHDATEYRKLAERLGRELELYRLVGERDEANGDDR